MLRPLISSVLALSIVGTSLAQANTPEKKVLKFLNWDDYVAEDTLEKFTAETGIEVELTTYDSEDEMALILDRGDAYDVSVTALAYVGQRLLHNKMTISGLHKSRFNNYGNLDAAALNTMGSKDPNNSFSIPYTWGTVGIGYNVEKVKEILGEDAPVDSWDLVLNPKNLKKLSQCGVSFVESPNEILPILLNYAQPGKLLSRKRSDFQKHVAPQLPALAPHIALFSSDTEYWSKLARGELCVSVGWSGDILQAMDLADSEELDTELAYSIPKEGTFMWNDVFVIPRKAENKDLAYQFLDFMMRPDVMGDVTNYLWYPNSIPSSNEYVDEEILNDESIYPAPSVMKNIHLPPFYSARTDEYLIDLWTNFVYQQ